MLRQATNTSGRSSTMVAYSSVAHKYNYHGPAALRLTAVSQKGEEEEI